MQHPEHRHTQTAQCAAQRVDGRHDAARRRHFCRRTRFTKRRLHVDHHQGGALWIERIEPMQPAPARHHAVDDVLTNAGFMSAKLCHMNARVDHLLDEALGLPTDERSALVVALLDSLEGSDDSAISDAWRQELRRRQAALRAGTVKPVPWGEAKARLSAL